MSHSDSIAGQHQLHSLHLQDGFHVAQDAGDIWCELLVLQLVNIFGADAFKQVNGRVMELRLTFKAMPSPSG